LRPLGAIPAYLQCTGFFPEYGLVPPDKSPCLLIVAPPVMKTRVDCTYFPPFFIGIGEVAFSPTAPFFKYHSQLLSVLRVLPPSGFLTIRFFQFSPPALTAISLCDGSFSFSKRRFCPAQKNCVAVFEDTKFHMWVVLLHVSKAPPPPLFLKEYPPLLISFPRQRMNYSPLTPPVPGDEFFEKVTRTFRPQPQTSLQSLSRCSFLRPDELFLFPPWRSTLGLLQERFLLFSLPCSSSLFGGVTPGYLSPRVDL